MKHNFVRMKSRAKSVSLRTLALVMGVVMLLSAIGVGSTLSAYAVSADESTQSGALSTAAVVGGDIADQIAQFKAPVIAEANAALRGDKADLADTGAEADVAKTAATGDWYIVGNVAGGNDWSERDAVKLSAVTGGYSIDIKLTENADFRLRHNSSDYGAASSSESDRKVSSSTSDHALAQSNQTFIWTGNTGTYTVAINSDGSKISFNSSVPGSGSGGSGSGSSTAIGTKVTDDSLLKILNGTDVSFYIESYTDKEWTDLCNSSKSTPTYTRYGKIGTRWGKAYVQIAKTDRTSYDRITNNKSDWNGDENTAIKSAVGGEHFVKSGSGNVSQVGSTTTINTTYLNTDTMSISTRSDATKTAFTENSNKVFDMTIKYYIKSGNDYYYIDNSGYTATTTAHTTSFALVGLTPGSYSLITLAVDSEDYVRYVADTDNFTVTEGVKNDVKVKSNNARLGTGTASPASAYAGQTVTVNVDENMGAFSAIEVKDASNNTVTTTTVTAGKKYTFVMPSSNATVNLTFTDYEAASKFYYNSYETSGSPSSTRYGQQMTEGKINGQEFSYYHVENRTGNDQLFTVSYGSPVYNSYNTYFSIYSGWESQGVKALFYATDGKNLGDWANMTFDSWDSTDKKKFRIAIPDGARSVRFKNGAGSDETDELFFSSGYNAWYHSGDGFKDVTAYKQSTPVPVNFYENFNGEGKYTDNFNTKGFYGHNANRGESHAYTKPKDLGTSSGDYYIVVLYQNKTYTINGETHTVDKDPEIIWMPKLPGTEDIDSSEVNVYGKDGSIVIDWNNKTASGATGNSGTAYGYSIIADTKLYDGTEHIGKDVDDDGASYESAKVVVTGEEGYDITIKTEIASDYRSKYYLKGWCINGVTYACGNNVKGVNASNAGTNGLYEMTYTIPAGTEDNAKIEITPIYYLKDNSGCITFYLEGYNTIQSKWGDTPYIYPFYGNLNNVDNSFGVYPGQPMVYADGKYSVEIPITNNPIIKATSDTMIKGITISNGYADHVHRNLVYKWTDAENDRMHKQTYDYDDFYKIYEECLKNGTEHPNSIIFRIQDEETVYNRATYGGGKKGQFATGTSNISISDIADSGNGWELLTNRYGNAVNIFGEHSGIDNPGSGVTAVNDTNDALYVVSTGYNANIAGDYGTMWKIYNGSGQLISNNNGRYGVPPSILLLRGTSGGYTTNIQYPSADRSVVGVGSYKDSIADYEAIYKDLKASTYTNKRVYITYEQDAQDTRDDISGTGANRLDGRWYYTHKSDSVTSTIGIEVWDEAQGKWVADTVTASTGTGTKGNTAKFKSDSYASDSNVITSNAKVIENNEKWNFTATAGTGYEFDSWQIKYSDTSYDEIVGAGKNYSIGATASYQLIARFIPTAEGNLTITHKLDPVSTGKGTVGVTATVGSTTYTGTIVDGAARIYIDNGILNTSSENITITLTTTPTYDGKVSVFGYDKFNTKNNITATTNPADLADTTENGETTSTFSFPVSSLFNISTQTTKTLEYTSVITSTLHYYNFVYNFTDRSGAEKSYTAKGEINQKDYETYVTNATNHTLDNSILVAKAPFESNFLKKNTLSKGPITYNDHVFSATSTFEQTDELPTYHVTFMLPYTYYTASGSADGIDYKKYTANSTTYNPNCETIDLAAKYNQFVTVNATSTTPDTAQTNVSKVTDSSDVNHAGNNFITAPEELGNKFFKYWEIKRMKKDGTTSDAIARVFYPDFHYRIYDNYYVEAVYGDYAKDSWKFNYNDEVNDELNDIRCSVLYLGDSRNQWNMNGNNAASNDATVAADKIYSDFIFNYVYNGHELKNSDNDIEVGMILERATYNDTDLETPKIKWLTGSTSVTDMDYYRANYGGNNAKSTESTRKTAISDALNNGTALPNGTIKMAWNKNELDNKNFTEQSYSAFSQYGQAIDDHSVSFATDNTIDNYVYRAYAYIKYTDGSDDKYVVSDPAYFCMRYTSNLKYTE